MSIARVIELLSEIESFTACHKPPAQISHVKVEVEEGGQTDTGPKASVDVNVDMLTYHVRSNIIGSKNYMDVYYASCLGTIKGVTKENLQAALEQLETIIVSSLSAPLSMP